MTAEAASPAGMAVENDSRAHLAAGSKVEDGFLASAPMVATGSGGSAPIAISNSGKGAGAANRTSLALGATPQSVSDHRNGNGNGNGFGSSWRGSPTVGSFPVRGGGGANAIADSDSVFPMPPEMPSGTTGSPAPASSSFGGKTRRMSSTNVRRRLSESTTVAAAGGVDAALHSLARQAPRATGAGNVSSGLPTSAAGAIPASVPSPAYSVASLSTSLTAAAEALSLTSPPPFSSGAHPHPRQSTLTQPGPGPHPPHLHPGSPPMAGLSMLSSSAGGLDRFGGGGGTVASALGFTPASASATTTSMMNGFPDFRRRSSVVEDGTDGEVKFPNGTGAGARRASSASANNQLLHKCESCAKVYRHPSCLVKHRWEHTIHWKEASKFLMSKHQQVQLLEAAAILFGMDAHAKSLPDEKAYWPAAVSPPSSGLLGSDKLNWDLLMELKRNNPDRARSQSFEPTTPTKSAANGKAGAHGDVFDGENGVMMDHDHQPHHHQHHHHHLGPNGWEPCAGREGSAGPSVSGTSNSGSGGSRSGSAAAEDFSTAPGSSSSRAQPNGTAPVPIYGGGGVSSAPSSSMTLSPLVGLSQLSLEHAKLVNGVVAVQRGDGGARYVAGGGIAAVGTSPYHGRPSFHQYGQSLSQSGRHLPDGDLVEEDEEEGDEDEDEKEGEDEGDDEDKDDEDKKEEDEGRGRQGRGGSQREGKAAERDEEMMDDEETEDDDFAMDMEMDQ